MLVLLIIPWWFQQFIYQFQREEQNIRERECWIVKYLIWRMESSEREKTRHSKDKFIPLLWLTKMAGSYFNHDNAGRHNVILPVIFKPCPQNHARISGQGLTSMTGFNSITYKYV